MGCSLWGHKESDKTKRLNNNDSLGYSLSDSSEELSQTGKGGARMYQFLLGEKKKKHIVKHQNISANNKNQTSQVNDFSAFLCIERCKSLGALKLFP